MKKEEKEEIKAIFKENAKSSDQLYFDMEIEVNEIVDIYHSIAKAWFFNNLDIPAEIKREMIKKEFLEIKESCKEITKKIDETLKSKKFNGK